ncbi:MAG: class I SAM-dependent RNA methyltransferase, partial [Pseudomonadota bacterium]
MTDLTIMRLGMKGDGIAAGPVYVPRTLPGEVVRGTVRDGRIDAPKIVAPSPDRVRPACPHYKSCGGCQLQHASDAFVEGWKAQVVADALAAQGLAAPITQVSTSPPESRRRATLAGRRLRSGPVVGFHAPRSEQIAAIAECRVLSPGLRAVLPVLSDITARAGSRRGMLQFAVTDTTSGIDCAVGGGGPLDAALARDLPRYGQHFARLSWDAELVMAETAPVVQLGPARVTPPPGAFLQATDHGQAALIEAVRRAVLGAKSIIDLFAGCGTFTLPLATGASLHAVDGEAVQLRALDQAARNTEGLKAVTHETRDLFRRPLDADELAGFDAAVIDPPRAGAAAQTAELARAALPRIAMVSCNPATFARDA